MARIEKTFDVEKDIHVGNHRRATFALLIPTLGMVPIEFAMTFSRMQWPVNCNSSSLAVKGMEVGVARNFAVEQVLAVKSNRPEYVLFMGDDMVPMWNSLVLLYEEMKKGEWDMLSGLYHMKAPDTMSIPVAWRNDIQGCIKNGVHYNVGETIPVDVAGLDFCLIKTGVFDKLGPAPWFKTADSTDMMNESGGIEIFTEDVFFSRKMKKAGMKIAVHTGVRIGHLLSTGEVF